MNVEYATHSPPKGVAFEQIEASETSYWESETANSAGSFRRGIKSSSRSEKQKIDADGGITKYTNSFDATGYTQKNYSQSPEYNSNGFLTGYGDPTAYDVNDKTQTNYKVTATYYAGVSVNSEKERVVYHDIRGVGRSAIEYTLFGKSWEAYERAKATSEGVTAQVTETNTDTFTKNVSGGKVGVESGDGTALTLDFVDYTRTYEKYSWQELGTKLQGNTNEPYGTYDGGGEKYLVVRGANVDQPDNKQIFAKTIVLENITDVTYFGSNANALPAGGHSYKFVSQARDEDISTSRIITQRSTLPVSNAGGLKTGRFTQQITEEDSIYTKEHYNFDSWDGGANASIMRGAVINLRAFSAERIQGQLHYQTKRKAILERGMNYTSSPTTLLFNAGRVMTDAGINTGREIKLRDKEPYTGFSFRSSHTVEDAFSMTHQTNTDRMIHNAQMHYLHSDRSRYDYGELIEVVVDYVSGGFVSGEKGNEKYFSLTFDGSIMPAEAGRYNDYLTTIKTSTGMGMGDYQFSFDRTLPAQNFVNSKRTTYAITEGTYETERWTNVQPYKTNVTETIYNYSTLIDYTNRSIRANTNTNLLGLPTVFYSAHISTDDQENSYIESCKYTVEESTFSEKVKDGTFAMSNMDDDQLFNYLNRHCGEITVSVVTVGLSQGEISNYQNSEETLDKFTYTKAGDTFENRDGYAVTVNAGYSENISKTLYFSPKASPYTYLMATTTTEDTNGILKGTTPEWFTTKFLATQVLTESVNFSIMPYLPTEFEKVERTTIYGSDFQGYDPEVIGVTHLNTRLHTNYVNWDRPYFQVMMGTSNVNHNHYSTKVALLPFYDTLNGYY